MRGHRQALGTARSWVRLPNNSTSSFWRHEYLYDDGVDTVGQEYAVSPARLLGCVCTSRHAARIMDVLAACRWSAQVPCVMCGRLVGGGVAYDFYIHGKCKPGPGPGCWYGEGCQAY